jgi:uncharacterized membrane protein YdjX (TVP38/TMEM64 family)
MTAKSQFLRPQKSKVRTFVRLLPIIGLVASFLAFFWLGLDRYLSLQALKENKELLGQWRDEHYLMSVLLFVCSYSVLISISVPVGIWMTLAGGFMFGTLAGGFFSLAGATLGAAVIFYIARYTLADELRIKCEKAMVKMEAGFEENQLSYMLVLRLVPLFPFWLVNLVPAFLNVSPNAYVIGTMLGMIPGALVYASVGNGLGSVFENGTELNIGIIFSPSIFFPVVGLAALALIPVIYKKKARDRD